MTGDSMDYPSQSEVARESVEWWARVSNEVGKVKAARPGFSNPPITELPETHCIHRLHDGDVKQLIQVEYACNRLITALERVERLLARIEAKL